MPRTFSHSQQVHTRPESVRSSEHALICRECGEPNSIRVHWTEQSYGTAYVQSHEIELDDFDTDGTELFEIVGFECTNCSLEGHDLYDVALREGEIFEGEEEDE